MKYAIIGTGKTGQAVLQSLPPQNVVAICNSRNPVTIAQLQQADVGIVFVPGKPFEEMIPILLESKTPLVIGSTGFDWPSDIDAQLRKANTAWIIGQNYSLGLNIMRHYAQQIKRTMNALRPNALNLKLSETHHIHKLDAPSGTALYIAQSLGFPRDDITAIREGEVKGIHTVSFDWPQDRIELTHESLDRGIYAEGVKMACASIKNLAAGLHNFENLVDTMISDSLKG